MTQSKQQMTGLRGWLARQSYPELAASLPARRRTPRRLMEEDRVLAALFREYLHRPLSKLALSRVFVDGYAG